MDLLIPAAISGVGLGCLYGLLGFAVVLLFKSTGVPNFAQGALCTLGAFWVFALIGQAGWPVAVAALAALAAAVLFGVVVFLGVMAPRGSAGPLNTTLRTLGLSLLLVAVMEFVWGEGAPYRFPPLITGAGLSSGMLQVSPQTLLATGMAVLVAAALWAFFRFTATGLSLRAVAEDADTARLLGVRTLRLGALSWGLSAALSLLVGVLIAPTAFLSPTMMDSYLLFAFTAVVLGGLTSLPGALLGGVIVGVVSNITAAVMDPELAIVVVFGLLMITLLVRPHGLLGQPQSARL
ncbi:branched-chain amino acid ABC transporter permease [Pseudonocardia kunmingensis]|uniref:Amino acid/amide ABC transporter membrane protein 1 (HAAT family) n=1 Tax=Pseudonocardia kunmingensis TaxID=630975 RepID=A0A543DP14_9PSEU|nr:branched-chain amino acid ABC transporter permease [Pseudonocardia kunmingensis]TQM11076.1 amino acid/amide ABC transporter membrane protein 1 (HAAT family) [Pseudonocardia kunmingensis]